MVLKKPDWMKIKVRGSGKFMAVEDLLSDLNLNTVCVEANCPNKMECFEKNLYFYDFRIKLYQKLQILQCYLCPSRRSGFG